jgi:hypothetical protein
MKKMPDLKKLFLNNTSKPRQTWRQQLHVMAEWAARHNELERRKKMLEITDGR